MLVFVFAYVNCRRPEKGAEHMMVRYDYENTIFFA